MNDTPKHILEKQFEIVMEKPLNERVKDLFEMTELSRRIVQNSIEVNNPDIPEVELKVELFKTFYRSDFDDHSLNQIVDSMRRFWNQRKRK